MKILDPLDVLNCRGRLLDLSSPIVMGILNITPDSFYDGGQWEDPQKAADRVCEMVAQGARIIDVGAMSSKPGAEELTEEEEIRRLSRVLPNLCANFSDVFFSIDAYRPKVVEYALSQGVHIVNDIFGGRYSDAVIDLCVEYAAPMIVMHMQGTPKYMQQNPNYQSVVLEVLDFLIERVGYLHERGLYDIVVDPGFGFGKSIADNYALLAELDKLLILELPILAGISRKSMIYNVLQTDPSDSMTLAATSALHLSALQGGAKILRVHDVSAAHAVVDVWARMNVHDRYS